VLVLGLLAAAAVFGLALLVGWATAPTHERLARAAPVRTTGKAPTVLLLRRAVPPPKAPPVRAARPPRSPRSADEIPRLIIGSG
jgi:hypothetical protein